MLNGVTVDILCRKTKVVLDVLCCKYVEVLMHKSIPFCIKFYLTGLKVN